MKALLFNILEQVDSTNNYAMQQIHEGLAMDGSAWMTRYQSAGKGQRGKSWVSQPGESILLSIAIQPPAVFQISKFHFNAFAALVCRQFIQEIVQEIVKVKWPNDLYIGDRKAGGILIENIIRGNSWNWAVIGMGINVNQELMEGIEHSAVSLKQITEKEFDVEELAKFLHQKIIHEVNQIQLNDLDKIIEQYNEHLFKRGETVNFNRNEEMISAKVIEVDEHGNLHTTESGSTGWRFGEVQWMLTL